MDVFLAGGCLVPGLYLAYTDAVKRLMYNKVVYPIFLLGFIFALYSGNYLSALLGSVFAFGAFLIPAYMFDNSVGGGDIKLAAALGIWFGYPDVGIVIAIGLVSALIWDISRMYFSGKLKDTLRNRIIPFYRGLYVALVFKVKGAIPEIPEDTPEVEFIPMGTFLILGAWITFIWRCFA